MIQSNSVLITILGNFLFSYFARDHHHHRKRCLFVAHHHQSRPVFMFFDGECRVAVNVIDNGSGMECVVGNW